jgi:hypothetical protein
LWKPMSIQSLTAERSSPSAPTISLTVTEIENWPNSFPEITN